jgi:soluble P-type ATPase
VNSKLIADGAEKAVFVRELGSRQCAAIGNGASDTEVAAAVVVCRSIGDALGLLLDDRALAATLRL